MFGQNKSLKSAKEIVGEKYYDKLVNKGNIYFTHEDGKGSLDLMPVSEYADAIKKNLVEKQKNHFYFTYETLYFIPQNMKNPHLNNNMWNNFNNNNNLNMTGPNSINNLNMNGPNNINNLNINDNFQGNKINNLYNKKDFNNRNNHNNNQINNKKYQKLYNHNTYQQSNINNNINHINNTNKLNQNNEIINNTNFSNSNNSNNYISKNNNIYNNNSINNTPIKNNNPPKKYLLSLRLKLNNNETEIINIKSLKDTKALLQEIKEKRNLNDKIIKLIQIKINNAVEIIQNIFDYNLNKYTYKNLIEINNQIINKREKPKIKLKIKEKEKAILKSKKYNSSKQLNKLFNNEMKFTINDIKKLESLNISY